MKWKIIKLMLFRKKKKNDMGITITDLPDEIDPVVLIEEKMKICPYCGQICDKKPSNWDEKRVFIIPYFDTIYKKADEKGKSHKILKFKNKYQWKKYLSLRCPSCGCKWDTGWFPMDHKMFEITLENKETNNNSLCVKKF